MIGPSLMTEAVAAVRTAALASGLTYETLAVDAVAHRIRWAETYEWPADVSFADAIDVARAVADRARAEDLVPPVVARVAGF